MISTSCSDVKQPDLTTEKLLEILARLKYDHPASLPEKRKVGWYEKKMNKLGWYRKTTVYVIDSRDMFKIHLSEQKWGMTSKCGRIYCRFCGAKMKRDRFGHKCPSTNCQNHNGADCCEEFQR